jgi:uncharacterized protein
VVNARRNEELTRAAHSCSKGLVSVMYNRLAGMASAAAHDRFHLKPKAQPFSSRLLINIGSEMAPFNKTALFAAFVGGAVIGALGGLVGLGGAEFRLPLLIGSFRFAVLEAVILNKAMSLVVVASALPFRARTISFADLGAQWAVILNLLAGSLLGAWIGATWAMRMKQERLYHIIAVLLVVIAAVLLFGHNAYTNGPALTGVGQAIAGGVAGLLIGIVASLLGVAGGELLIPTLILLYGADIKLAGSLALVVSLPTMLVGFTRYSRDQRFVVLKQNRSFVLTMAAGSLAGSFIGGRLLGVVPSTVLLPLLAAILLVSAVKVWFHETSA